MDARHRLRSRADFERVTREGRRTATPEIVAYRVVRPERPEVRVGLSVGRRLGTAVIRNRTKRRLREAVRPLIAALEPCDLVIVARERAVTSSVDDLSAALRAALNG